MVTGMAFLIVSDAVSKYLAETHPLMQVMCLRQAACLLFVIPFVVRGAGLSALRMHNVPMQFVRGLVFLCSSYLIILSLSLLPLPTVTAITFIGPIMIAMMSVPLLHERVGASLWLATLLGFVGVLFIIRPGTDAFSWALLVPVAAAFASSMRDMLSRILARTDNSISILFWSSLVMVRGLRSFRAVRLGRGQCKCMAMVPARRWRQLLRAVPADRGLPPQSRRGRRTVQVFVAAVVGDARLCDLGRLPGRLGVGRIRDSRRQRTLDRAHAEGVECGVDELRAAVLRITAPRPSRNEGYFKDQEDPNAMKLAILDDYMKVALGAANWDGIRRRGVEITVFDTAFSSVDDAAAKLAPFEIVNLLRERTHFPRALIERLPNLKLIAMTGRRAPSLDIAAATDRKVLVCNTHGGEGGASTAEMAWTLLLAAARDLTNAERGVRAGRWHEGVRQARCWKDAASASSVWVGSAAKIAAYGKAFGMEVVAWSQNLTAERAAECGARLVSREELFSSSDFISIHIVLSDRTRGLIGAADFARMKPSAILVNTSRGPIVNEADVDRGAQEPQVRACRARCLRARAAAGRSSVAKPGPRDAGAAPRLREYGRVRALLRRIGEEHRSLARRQADQRAQPGRAEVTSADGRNLRTLAEPVA